MSWAQLKTSIFWNLRWSWWLFGAAFFQISGNIIGCKRHSVLFWVQMGYFSSCENNTGCQWQLILFPPSWKSCTPYSYQDRLSIQNVKVLSWATKFQNPNPKSDPGSSTTSSCLFPQCVVLYVCWVVSGPLTSHNGCDVSTDTALTFVKMNMGCGWLV